jgi:GNAT superfamily N-acetyltransferase
MIRDIDPKSEAEIRLVAQRMRQTLVEVIGEERAIAMYTMDWLVDRVRWHLDREKTDGRVFLLEADDGHVAGQAIARVEHDVDGTRYGYFSTIFVEPESRRKGNAVTLVRHVESWFREKRMPKIVYNTAKDHKAIISLFSAHGYRITHAEDEMIQLTKILE